MRNKNNYKDIIIIDKDGIILYADIGNLLRQQYCG